MHACVRACMYVCVYIYIYTYTHIHPLDAMKSEPPTQTRAPDNQFRQTCKIN